MPGWLDKEETEKVSNRLNSLRVIKETVEEMGAACKINWQTELVKIDGPLPDLAYAIAIEVALARAGFKEEYAMGEGEDNNVFIDNTPPDEPNETLH